MPIYVIAFFCERQLHYFLVSCVCLFPVPVALNGPELHDNVALGRVKAEKVGGAPVEYVKSSHKELLTNEVTTGG